jgi:Holliday junction resolvase-like predicted endonuclease
VFVESGAAVGSGYGDAVEAISPLKRRRVAAMALTWPGPAGSFPCRFDVVAIGGIQVRRRDHPHRRPRLGDGLLESSRRRSA